LGETQPRKRKRAEDTREQETEMRKKVKKWPADWYRYTC
jgi:hypothetical protein